MPGLESNWIDISGGWTRGEALALGKILDADGMGEQYFALLRQKTSSCHIELNSGDVITSPDDLCHDIDDIDLALWAWLQGVLIASIGERMSLGKGSALPLSALNGDMVAQKVTA